MRRLKEKITVLLNTLILLVGLTLIAASVQSAKAQRRGGCYTTDYFAICTWCTINGCTLNNYPVNCYVNVGWVYSYSEEACTSTYAEPTPKLTIATSAKKGKPR